MPYLLFLEKWQNLNCRLLQIIVGVLRVNSYFIFKGTDQTAWIGKLVWAFVVSRNRVRVFFRVEAHMMLKPRLPGYAPDCDSNEYHEKIEN